MGKASGGTKAGARDQQRSGGGTGLLKGDGASCLGEGGQKFTAHLANKDQEVFLVVVVSCCYFCLLTCGGFFFPFQFNSQY